MPSIAESILAAVDAGLAAGGFRVAGAGFVARAYEGALADRPARAELSVVLETRHTPAGFVLTFEIDLGVPTRLLAGREVPLLLGRGLPTVAEVDGVTLRAHDPGWARRFVDDPEARSALGAILREASSLEIVPPGILRLQFQRQARPVVPDLAPLVRALDAVARATLRPPAPPPAPATLSDRRGLMLAFVALAVLGAFAAAIAAYVAVVPR